MWGDIEWFKAKNLEYKDTNESKNHKLEKKIWRRKKRGIKKLVDGKVQRYKCQECGHYFTNQEKYHHLSEEKIDMIHRLYKEKGEQRKIARVLGISLKTVQYHLKKN